MRLSLSMTFRIVFSLVGLQLIGVRTGAPQELALESKTVIAHGWHPWYEIKSDPSNSNALIACGMQWNAKQNAFSGFVYNSEDGGKSWALAMLDRSSPWVSEISCAFGPNHVAYLISEASAVVDGIPNHSRGTTRLFVSTDSGRHWAETLKTGWADHSTSAVNMKTGSLYTFYQTRPVPDRDGNLSASIGLLVFSRDGLQVSGAFMPRAFEPLTYQGVYPSHALALKDGSVATLFLGRRKLSDGTWEDDLGLERVDSASERKPKIVFVTTCIERGKSCLDLQNYSLAYDPLHEKLFVVYVEAQGQSRQLILTTSNDLGRTWSKGVLLSDSKESEPEFHLPSLAIGPEGVIGLMWEEKPLTGRWRFSTIENDTLIAPAIQLSKGTDRFIVRNSALWTVIEQPNPPNGEDVAISVRSELNRVWATSGLVGSATDMKAIWISSDEQDESLEAGILVKKSSRGTRESDGASRKVQGSSRSSSQAIRGIVVAYDGQQEFDAATKTLSVDMRLINRSDEIVRTPIKLEVVGLSSTIGQITILNATNGLSGVGAEWNVSESLTGDLIPPGITSNTFRLSFKIQEFPAHSGLNGEGLLKLGLRILSGAEEWRPRLENSVGENDVGSVGCGVLKKMEHPAICWFTRLLHMP